MFTTLIRPLAVSSGLLALAHAAPGQETLVDFTSLGNQATSELQVADVTITADDGAAPAEVQLLNLNGIGVVGGAFDTMTDGSEALHFTFPGHAFAATYGVFVANNLDFDGFVGEHTLEAFDGTTSLGVVDVDDTGLKNVPAMFGGAAITSFTVRAAVDGNRIDKLIYELVWKELGNGLAGTNGVPALTGDGPLTPGSTTSLTLTNGLGLAPTWIILGFSEVSLPFMGGVLVPSPDRIVGPFFLDGNGELTVTAAWPAGVPAGTKAWWQTWSMDAAAIGGFAGSNAVQSTTY